MMTFERGRRCCRLHLNKTSSSLHKRLVLIMTVVWNGMRMESIQTVRLHVCHLAKRVKVVGIDCLAPTVSAARKTWRTWNCGAPRSQNSR